MLIPLSFWFVLLSETSSLPELFIICSDVMPSLFCGETSPVIVMLYVLFVIMIGFNDRNMPNQKSYNNKELCCVGLKNERKKTTQGLCSLGAVEALWDPAK